jgi:hypothetical protein
MRVMSEPAGPPPIHRMPAGRAMDYRVWTEVLGREVKTIGFLGVEDQGVAYAEWAKLPEFSTDIAAAWQIVEKERLHISPWEMDGGRRGWIVSEMRDLNSARVYEIADSAPLAICRAALRRAGQRHAEARG